jgi:DNA uptake protein ComE-like DNA-binding protein
MVAKQLLSALAIIGLMSAPVLAQPTTTTPVRPPVATPATPAPSVQTPAAVPAVKKTNLNTANAADLDALPDVGKARSKVILDERAKGNFKDWADFDKRMTGTSVNAGVKAKIKDLVTF